MIRAKKEDDLIPDLILSASMKTNYPNIFFPMLYFSTWRYFPQSQNWNTNAPSSIHSVIKFKNMLKCSKIMFFWVTYLKEFTFQTVQIEPAPAITSNCTQFNIFSHSAQISLFPIKQHAQVPNCVKILT